MHLHTHSEYSILDGLGSPDSIAKRSFELGFKYIAISDHASADGFLKFQSACNKYGISPIYGVEFYIVPDGSTKEKDEKRGHILALAKNDIGVNNIFNMLTVANLSYFYSRPRIDYELLLNNCDGLIFSTGCSSSFVNLPTGVDFLKQLINKTNGNVFGEIMSHCTDIQCELNNKIVKLSNELDFDLVATVDNHYSYEEYQESHDVLLAIQSKKTWNDPKRWKFDKKYKLYLMTPDEIISEFEKQGAVKKQDYLRAMKNTLAIAQDCKGVKISKKEMNLPPIPGFENVNENRFLRELVLNGYYDKIASIIHPTYELRIEEELNTIYNMNFSRYFLIMWDLVKWCRENGILVSTRGSVGNSLVAYLIDIVKIDPIQYNLPFARFLNESRGDAVDVDLDISHNKRSVVFDRLKSVYGEYNVANVSTFLTIKDNLSVRDVSRVFEVPLEDVNKFTKVIDETENNSIVEAFDTNEGKEFSKKYPNVVKHTKILKGAVRGKGSHAAGLIVSKDDLRTCGRCYLQNGKHGININWEKNDAEYQGLIKFDLLGLKNLTAIDETVRLIKENHNIDIDVYSIPLDDNNVYREVSKGNTVGIFQIGTAGATKHVIDIGIDNIYTWSDAIALIRPGPKDSGMLEDYIKRKHGEDWDKKHLEYEKMLQKTYGVVVYQDDLINIINKIAGLPFTASDNIRKIVAKKRDKSELEPYRKQFVDGCINVGILDKKDAEEIWDGFEKHSRYSFNKSHSMQYAIVGYITAWLKYYYPSEFIVSCLNHMSDGQKPDLIREARRMGLNIKPPKIGISDPLEWKCNKDNLYIPFVECKFLGEKTLDKLQLPKYESGFYTENKVEIKGKPKKILDEIKAFDKDEELPLEAYKYFDFDLSEGGYNKLLKLLNVEKSEIDIDKAFRGELTGLNLLKKRSDYPEITWEELSECKECELRCEDCKPVFPSVSKFNMMVIGECPGADEMREGRGFVGKAGKRLWEELSKYDLHRWAFHTTNTAKCWNKSIGTPKETHIAACSHWLDKEIEVVKPFIILVLGNVARLRLCGEKFGINRVNNTCSWNDKYGTYLFYCLHPSSTFRSEENNENFKLAIKGFSEKITNLGGV